jgi:hydrogenase expression/formation protein HypE
LGQQAALGSRRQSFAQRRLCQRVAGATRAGARFCVSFSHAEEEVQTMGTIPPRETSRVDEVLKKIERTREARRHKFYLRDEKITLSHGSGGKATHNLIEGVFAPAFSNPMLDAMDDSATFAINGTGQRLAFTTDTYVVSPLFFPGGDIGKLAVHGTINDLAMAGAPPLYLSAGFILE